MSEPEKNRTISGQFAPGSSGNPSGRPKGSRNWTTSIREDLREVVPEVLGALIGRAKEGDTQAAKLVLERALPALRPTDATVEFAAPQGDLSEQGRAVLSLMSNGELSPDQTTKLIQALAGQARLIEITELEQRIAALEEQK